MTFTELKTEIMDRLNLSSPTAETRVGRAINRTYRKITTAIGLQLSRRTTVSETVDLGNSLVVFSSSEKVIDVWNRTTTPYRKLKLLTLEEIREGTPYGLHDNPTEYAIHSHTSDTVTIEINCVPQTAFTLYADVHQVVSDLSGSNEPAFPESFHDVIIEGVLADEYRKLEKIPYSQMSQKEYERILSDLRMWIAKENSLDIYQGKTPQSGRGGGGSSSGAGFNGAQSWTQTGNINFDRDPSAPFTVTSGSAAVDNLNAALNAGLADTETITGDWTHTGALIIPTATAPVQTTEGSISWDSDDNLLTMGDGAARRYINANYFQNATENATTGTNHNWALTMKGNTLLQWSGGGNLTLTGIAGGQVGQHLVIRNESTSDVISFAHDSGSSSAGNKFFNIYTGGPSLIAAGGYAHFVYDGAYWIMVAESQGVPIAWTPTLTFVTPGDLNVVYSSRAGTYIREGKKVTATFEVVTSAFTHTTASGVMSLTGLPIDATSASVFTGAVWFTGVTLGTHTSFVARAGAPSLSSIDIVASGSGVGATQLTTAHVPSGGTPIFVGSVVYFIA